MIQAKRYNSSLATDFSDHAAFVPHLACTQEAESSIRQEKTRYTTTTATVTTTACPTRTSTTHLRLQHNEAP